jgi:flagellar basal body-associated protein FliL
MKMKKPAFIALISMILCGIGILGFLEIRNRLVTPRQRLQLQTPKPDSDRSASISISAVLLLLAVGISGALSVRRRRKNNRRSAQKIEPEKIPDDRNRAFVRLNKQYLNLQYKITQNKFSGENPPDQLLKEISDLERKVRLISRALE